VAKGAQDPSGESSSARDLLESAERVARIGSWEWTPETGELRWSDNLFRLVGLEPGSVTPTTELVQELTHPDDRERQAEEVERLRQGASHQSFEYRLVHADGSIRHMRSRLADIPASEGMPKRILGTVQDVTDRRRVESRIAAHLAVSETLAGWESFDQGFEDLICSLCRALDCVAGSIWIPEGDALVAVSFWRQSELSAGDEFETATRKLRLPRGRRLPGRVWQTGAPIAIGVGASSPFLRRREAQASGMRGALALPVLDGDEVLAVVELYSREDVEPDEELVRSLIGIGHELGQFLVHHRGELGSSPLTPRELEVLQLAAGGNSRPEIAERLTISPATVKTHFEHIYEKLEVGDRAAAVAWAMRAGLID